jgi:hypothetical protein
MAKVVGGGKNMFLGGDKNMFLARGTYSSLVLLWRRGLHAGFIALSLYCHFITLASRPGIVEHIKKMFLTRHS